jgi:sugar/nucleoside kinase (ribokinase family)
MMEIDVIGLGVSTVDIVSLVDHFPAEEEVQRANDMTVQGGGPVATAMVALARLGAKVAMIDAIGDDWRGALIREEFQREGVVEHLKVRKDGTSSTACILVTRHNGARSIVYFPGTAPELSPADIPRTVIESAKILHVNGRHWDACLQAVKMAREAHVKVSFDGGAHRYHPELDQLVPLTDICIIARDFAEKYTRETDIRRCAKMLLESGPSLVVITDGIKGSWIQSQEGQAFHQPAHRLPQLLDTTGCGDSYHGAFLFGLLKGFDLEQTALFASAVAALNTQRLGGRSGLPTYQKTKSFLAAKRKSLQG